ncbi:MAG: hypothetical protein B6U77_02770 [Candidatus Hecatellales archaeon ex4484_218]|nr:MAG: hypothetical protein B6U77_02770 [Candidatus Hecatellales archaeon ex4484_218]
MRIYFAPCGIGLGHVGRSLEVAKYLKLKKPDCKILFSTYSDALIPLKTEGFRFVEAPKFEYWVWPDGTPDPWRTLKWLSGKILGVFLKQLKFEVKQVASFKPDIIFSDSRLSTTIVGWLLGKPVITMLNQFHVVAPGFVHYKILQTLSDIFSFTFLADGWGLSSKILIPDFPPPYSISTLNLRIPPSIKRKIIFVGPILPVKPENLPNQEILRKKFGFDSRPLIYVAVSGPKWERFWLGKKLLKYFSGFPEKYQIIVSLGIRENPNVWRRGNLTVYGWLKERFEVLKACDLVVGRGGHTTLTQTLAYGKPMLLIPTPEQTEQIYNAKSAVKLGVAKVLDQRKLSKDLLLSKIKEIFNDKKYWKNAEKLRKIALNFDCLKTTTNLILSYSKK